MSRKLALVFGGSGGIGPASVTTCGVKADRAGPDGGLA